MRETREVSTAMSVAELPIPSTSTLRVHEALVGLAVLVRVDCSPANDSWPGKGGSGYLRVPVVAVGDDHRVVAVSTRRRRA